ncbi:MAG TPA: rhomboid family intramembrane serine protease [Tepidisphaeraceae bacterium]
MAWQDRAYNQGGDYRSGDMRMGFPVPTPMSIAVMVACFVVFVLQSMSPAVTDWGAFTFAYGLAWKEPWRWIAYQYLHGGESHIFWNLLGIYFFLPPLERIWGPWKAFVFYTLGGIAAGLAYGLLSLQTAHLYPLIGASGSIMACLGAVALLFPEMGIWLIVIVIPIRVMALLYGLWFALTVIASHELSNAAHLGGLVFGVIAPLYGVRMVRKFQSRYEHMRAQNKFNQERADEELVDRILQKVHDSGMNSLSRGERRALKQATERQRVSEISRGRKGY